MPISLNKCSELLNMTVIRLFRHNLLEDTARYDILHRSMGGMERIKKPNDRSEHWITYTVDNFRTSALATGSQEKTGELPPNSLHHICCGIMRYLRTNGQPSIDFYTDSNFADFKATLDSEMKRLQSKGVGSKTKQADILSVDEEELLWEGGYLGDSTPQSLLDTMVFCNGLYFALSRTPSAPLSSMSDRGG